MAENVAEDFSLERLSAQTGLSKLHFQRLFKRATGVSPSRYHINLRMNAARRLLRETKKSVVVALDVGYAIPCSKQTHPHARQAPVSLSNPALKRRGTPIRWVRT